MTHEVTISLNDEQLARLRDLKAYRAGTLNGDDSILVKRAVEAVDEIAAKNDGRTGGFSRDQAVVLALNSLIEEAEEGVVKMVLAALE